MMPEEVFSNQFSVLRELNAVERSSGRLDTEN